MLAALARHFDRARLIDAGRRRNLGAALLCRLQLQQQEQPLEDRHLATVLGEIEPPGIALLLHLDSGAAVIEQEVVEIAQVNLEAQAVRRALDQDALQVFLGEPHVVRLHQQPLDARDELGARLGPARIVELDEARCVAVRAEGEIVLDEIEQALAVGLMTPGGEAIERAAEGLLVAATLGQQGKELGS